MNIIGNIEEMQDDLDIIDGYDEVGGENQDKIRTALLQGHVPDEDWKGVSVTESKARTRLACLVLPWPLSL